MFENPKSWDQFNHKANRFCFLDSDDSAIDTIDQVDHPHEDLKANKKFPNPKFNDNISNQEFDSKYQSDCKWIQDELALQLETSIMIQIKMLQDFNTLKYHNNIISMIQENDDFSNQRSLTQELKEQVQPKKDFSRIIGMNSISVKPTNKKKKTKIELNTPIVYDFVRKTSPKEEKEQDKIRKDDSEFDEPIKWTNK
jgi:hypothetical protein